MNQKAIAVKNFKIPSPKEIKEKYQKPKEREDIPAWYIHRPVSKYLTHYLLRIWPTINAEYIAFSTIIWDILTVYLIYTQHWIWAAFFTYFHVVIDSMDGEVARIQMDAGIQSRKRGIFGGFWDSMMGLIAFPFVVFATAHFMGHTIVGVFSMALFYIVVAASAYTHVWFPERASVSKSLQSKIKSIGGIKITGPISFDSTSQKMLIALALLFQTTIFLWIFMVGAVVATIARMILYSRRYY
ncbi:MAG: hypothetical protein AABW80_04260 [Nanoarchaeota archaeon]